MSRRMDAPPGQDCPYRHNCPHSDGLSTTWVMENYQEAFELREQLDVMERRYQQRSADLEKTLLERDAKIAQLRLQHQKRFKADKPAAPPRPTTARRRGAPPGHPGWHRRQPDHIDRVVPVAAPAICPHCRQPGLKPYPEIYEHIQEDIVLAPRTHVAQFVHQQSWCPK